jgi:SNF2 family DNA or RNA helicase
MGLGKTIACVSLIAATLNSAQIFAASSEDTPSSPPSGSDSLDASHFAGSVWGMPTPEAGTSQKAKAKAAKTHEKLEAVYARISRIKARSRATLVVCPLSTVSNWGGEVSVFGGSGGTCLQPVSSQSLSLSSLSFNSADTQPEAKPTRVRQGTPLRVYVYHGNARRPDPAFLADFDAVITTYATLASEFSKQNRSTASAEDEEDDYNSSEGAGGVDIDEHGNQVLRLPKTKKGGLKRKKPSAIASNGTLESTSPLQSIHWFRVILDEAQ